MQSMLFQIWHGRSMIYVLSPYSEIWYCEILCAIDYCILMIYLDMLEQYLSHISNHYTSSHR